MNSSNHIINNQSILYLSLLLICHFHFHFSNVIHGDYFITSLVCAFLYLELDFEFKGDAKLLFLTIALHKIVHFFEMLMTHNRRYNQSNSLKLYS